MHKHIYANRLSNKILSSLTSSTTLYTLLHWETLLYDLDEVHALFSTLQGTVNMNCCHLKETVINLYLSFKKITLNIWIAIQIIISLKYNFDLKIIEKYKSYQYSQKV